MAGVSRSTVYLVFGSRAGMFLAFAGDLLERGGFGLMLEIAAHPDAREGLRGGIRATVEMYANERDVIRALVSMAQLDADAVWGAVQRLEQGRAIGARYRAERLANQRILRSDVTLADATHLLWLLTSFDAFDLLYTGQGLTIDAAAVLLADSAERSLCIPDMAATSPKHATSPRLDRDEQCAMTMSSRVRTFASVAHAGLDASPQGLRTKPSAAGRHHASASSSCPGSRSR